MDFFVVGAEKSGTTWLAEMLKLHPQVYVPDNKELHYFNRRFDEAPEIENYNFDKPITWYYSFFESADPCQVKGEVCPSYLWDEYAPGRIYQYFPGAKIIIVLRDPVERAFSAYRFWKQRGVIPHACTFQQAVDMFPHHLIKRGEYFDQITRYQKIFGSDRVLIMLMDNLKSDNAQFLSNIESFLGVDRYIPESINERFHVTGSPKLHCLNAFFSELRRFIRKHQLYFVNDLVRKFRLAEFINEIRRQNIREASSTDVNKMKDSDRNKMHELFREEVDKLESLLDRDLSDWKQSKYNL